MTREEPLVFALGASRDFGAAVCMRLGVTLAEHEERDFEDGEHKTRPLVNVRDRDVCVIHSLYSDHEQSVNDKLCRLLFFLGAVRDAGAGRVTAIVPYLAYARKDRKTKLRDPVTTRYIAQFFEAVQVDRVLTLDVHNLAAFQNAARNRTDHLDSRKLFVDYFEPIVEAARPVVVSPDVGGIKRAEPFRQMLSRRIEQDVPMAFLEKQRSAGVVSGEAFVGDVENRLAIVVDDIISSGTTLARTANACRSRGAQTVYAAATHGLFVKNAAEVIADPAIEKVAVTNTVPPFRLDPDLQKRKVDVVDAAPLFAEAIHLIHTGGAIEEYLED